MKFEIHNQVYFRQVSNIYFRFFRINKAILILNEEKKLVFYIQMQIENHFLCFEAAFYRLNIYSYDNLFDVTVSNIKLLLIVAYLRTNKTEINNKEYFCVFQELSSVVEEDTKQIFFCQNTHFVVETDELIAENVFSERR